MFSKTVVAVAISRDKSQGTLRIVCHVIFVRPVTFLIKNQQSLNHAGLPQQN